MKASILEVIGNVLSADDSITTEQRDAILRSCRQNVPKRKLIGAKVGLEILGISSPTLRSYVANGQLEQVNFSSRRVRFNIDASHVKVLCHGSGARRCNQDMSKPLSISDCNTK